MKTEGRCGNFCIFGAVAPETNHRKIFKALTLLLCAIFLLAAVSRDYKRKATNESAYLQSLNSQGICISAVSKIVPLFPIKEINAGIASSTWKENAIRNVNLQPYPFFASLIERISFYAITSINAP
jgi:hypothetical protein